ncbi:unnamed protein product, partial [marine sediment metagenome]
VVIVGSHNRTRHEVPWDEPGMDFWIFNESASIGWPKKVDALFQMHAEPVWKNPLNRNDPNYPEWIKQEHPFPIFMLDNYDEVPSAESYPLDEIRNDNTLGKLYRGEKRIEFFTSSVAYAIARAVKKDYKVLRLFGVEMESETEYKYQGEGVHYWLGVARGRGIDVYVSGKSRLFSEPLYGYEGGAYLGREQLLERQVILDEHAQKLEIELDDINEQQKGILEKSIGESNGKPGLASPESTQQFFQIIKAQEQSVHDNGMFAGARTEIVRYLEKCDH